MNWKPRFTRDHAKKPGFVPKTLGFPGNPLNSGQAVTGSWLNAAPMGWSRV